ncbi:CsbD family protein [Ancylobacter sp. WKF20]|uniref:CsbD family protein n=1 Tax=Ancylobacter sp. WKF20 TaxID=3039801 RepID=UPI00243460E5|nr:CsbD family protein [Ancylobacter sp. WKF20]WGD29119.1 CsbD family protein [Ancylobacter sp. WKF20]
MNSHQITGAARQIGGRLRNVAGQVSHDAALRGEGVYEEALGRGQRLAGDAREQAVRLADGAYDMGQEYYDRGVRALAQQTRAHPLAVVLAAGLTGAALAWLFSSSRRR